MKKAVLILLLPIGLSAQTRQGVIVFERKVDVHRTIQDEQMKAMVPQFQTGAYEVLFSDSIAIYKAMPKDEAPDPFDNNTGGNHFVFRFGGSGDGVLYRNYSSGRVLEEAILAETKYIITDTLRQLPWKLSDETATVLGHPCKKATTTTPRGGKVVAWYAGDIPLPVGPEQFNGLSQRYNTISTILGFIAVVCSTTNVVGGFVITDRMLKMFKRKEIAKKD